MALWTLESLGQCITPCHSGPASSWLACHILCSLDVSASSAVIADMQLIMARFGLDVEPEDEHQAGPGLNSTDIPLEIAPGSGATNDMLSTATSAGQVVHARARLDVQTRFKRVLRLPVAYIAYVLIILSFAILDTLSAWAVSWPSRLLAGGLHHLTTISSAGVLPDREERVTGCCESIHAQWTLGRGCHRSHRSVVLARQSTRRAHVCHLLSFRHGCVHGFDLGRTQLHRRRYRVGRGWFFSRVSDRQANRWMSQSRERVGHELRQLTCDPSRLIFFEMGFHLTSTVPSPQRHYR